MKKTASFIIFLIMAIFLVVSTATAQQQPPKTGKRGNQNMSLSKNKEMILRLFDEVINQRNLSFFDQVYVADAIDHSAFPGQAPGTAGIKSAVQDFLETFPDLKVTVEDVIAEGDKVATRETWKGTHKPTGKVGTGSIIHIFLIRDGKVTEEWSQGWDWLEKF